MRPIQWRSSGFRGLRRLHLALPLILLSAAGVPALDNSEYYAAYKRCTAAQSWIEGEELFRSAVEEYPANLDFHCFLNIALRKKGKFEEALRLLKPLYEREGTYEFLRNCYVWSLVEYGQTLREARQLARALPLMEEAFGLNPRDLGAILWYGILLRETGNLDQSIQVLEGGKQLCEDQSITANLYPEASFIHRNIEDALYRYGRHRDQVGDYAKAASIYAEAAKRFPDSLFFHYLSFYDYLHLKAYEEATATLVTWLATLNGPSGQERSAEEILAGEIDVSYRLGDLLSDFIAARHFTRASALLDRVSPLFSNSFLPMGKRGELLWQGGKKEEGVALADRAYELCVAEHPQGSALVELPLRGTMLVAVGNHSSTVITHAGLSRHCFDFMGCAEDGATVRVGVQGLGKNGDYIGFGMDIVSPVNGVVSSVANDAVDHPPAPEWQFAQAANSITLRVMTDSTTCSCTTRADPPPSPRVTG